ncbi:hypothetical protein HNR23_005029 [Nocardiopsis mwathae]|uniref:Uncharacterized protein n=1 Tax=Nocardiopsis mwathae TaxID=1472723 RepID=A0A7W9YMN2_9ACTN|nr:hypothetical protein [Nocardiopsis mwathae]MBB6174969.1 hypothetical protein [Nocardiopsis mwathae]
MSSARFFPPCEKPRLRLLYLDADVGSSALLLLSAQGAIHRFDHAIFPDPGWYPAAVYAHVRRLENVAADAGIGIIRSAIGSCEGSASRRIPVSWLPLFTRGIDGSLGRLPNSCAWARARAVESEAQRLHGDNGRSVRPHVPVAQCAIGLGSERTVHTSNAELGSLDVTLPLQGIGWSARDCRAYLFSHGIADVREPLCIACPNRSGASWRELKATDPAAWEQAVAIDAAIRHGGFSAATPGMPPGSTCYLHPSRVPLPDADLDRDVGLEGGTCTLWVGDDSASGENRPGGGAA